MRRLMLLGCALPALLALAAWATADDKKNDGTGCTLLLFTAAAADDKKDDSGWVPLFNGKDLTGWKLHPQPNKRQIAEVIPKMEDGKLVAYEAKLKKDETVVPLWRVEDGILIGGGPHSHLFTERGDYENFSFRVEVMINDHGNSGQYFRTQFTPEFPRGYEAQINATHGDPIKSGSLYPAFRKLPKEEQEKIIIRKQLIKPDEWYTQEVTADGNHIVIKVNGETTVDFVDENKTYMLGHFALQGHDPGTVVKFRKIEVKELPGSK